MNIFVCVFKDTEENSPDAFEQYVSGGLLMLPDALIF